MSRFTRKGTVSKGSGPIHLDSYALKGIPIRYTPPIFVPELLLLPASWKPPVLPPRESLRYDYRVEKAVLELARNRAISIAAEHSLQMKEIERLRAANQLVESRDEESDESIENSLPVQVPKPRPPIIPGDNILTPTPVAVGITSQSSSESSTPAQTGSTGSEPVSQVSVKRDSDFLISLGESSLREFEGDTSDPFEITSLQAINEMEILQTVLQPVATPTTTAVGTTPTASSSANVTQTPPPAVTTALTRNSSSAGNLSSHSQPVISSTVAPASSPGVATVTPTLPVQVPQRASSSPSVGVVTGTSPSNPFLPGPAATPPTVNPFYPRPVLPSSAPPQPSTNPFQATSPPATGHPPPSLGHLPGPLPPLHTPDVGRLIDIGSTAQPPTSSALPLQSTAAAASNIPQQVVPPIPKPRTAPPPSTISPPTPSAAAVATSQQSRNPIFPTVQQGRIGLGVPVLPPISSHTHSTGLSAPPPYKVKPSPPNQRRDGAPPPPPYSATGSPSPPVPRERSRLPSAAIPPPVVPRTYKLPDPSSSLSEEQKKEMQSISGMGFPPPRVARALVKCDGDRTKVFDFLFLVGQLEEKGHSGDSAETALLACNEKVDEAVEYLGKVEGYRAMGFPEKAIHDAYGKSNKDWDKTLDILIQER